MKNQNNDIQLCMCADAVQSIYVICLDAEFRLYSSIIVILLTIDLVVLVKLSNLEIVKQRKTVTMTMQLLNSRRLNL